MTDIFLMADTHFCQDKIVTVFKREDGSPQRDFANIEEHDETLISNWNSVVRPQDKIYHLGDVAMAWKPKGRIINILYRLNGHKRLIMGNHDMWGAKAYLEFFDEIYATRVFNPSKTSKVILSHIPLRIESLDRWDLNIHGHVHCNTIDHPKYFNVSAENINYTPIALDTILSKI